MTKKMTNEHVEYQVYLNMWNYYPQWIAIFNRENDEI